MRNLEKSPLIRLFDDARRFHQSGQLSAAEDLCQQILALDGGHADALHLRGLIAYQRGRKQLGAELIGKAIDANGQVADYHSNLGVILYELGRADDAVRRYDAALRLNPAYVEALSNLGIALKALGRLGEAARSYRIALCLKPDFTKALVNLGIVLKDLGTHQPSLSAYRRALRILPDLAEAHFNLANLFYDMGRLDEAAQCHISALCLRPGYDDALCSLGTVRKDQSRLSDAQRSYSRALTSAPDQAEARLGLAIAPIPVVAMDRAESGSAVENFTRALDGLADWSKTHPGRLAKAVGSSQPFHLAYRPENILAPLSRYGDLICASIADPRQHRPVFADPAPGRPVRMVIISAHMRRHSVWDMILRGIVAHIDRQKFEIFLYHTQAPSDDETTWARTRAERFVQGPRSMRAWLDDIARDRPDVIFYPELGMDPVSCVLAAQRLAPLQIASWGHPVTTGLPTIDLFFSGELLEADDADSHYRERLVRLPGTGVCTESPELDAIPWSGPASRSDDIVRFALCQAPFKFDPADDVLLARIAKASGACQFWLASSERINWPIERLKQRLGNALRAEGLDPDAILRVIPRLPRRQFFSFLDQMDVYLDCPAFSGYTTAWQAIHRGLPIVTLEGPLMRQRLAAGLLRQIGVTEGIASTKEHYIGTAIAWGQESRRSDRWQARRLAIRQAAPKADGNQAAVRALEAAVIDALQGKRHDRPEPIPVGMSRG